ncbi:YbhB/YbcL family Raf kinase inhibitor-like protein [Streptomyces bungoensis]|uniref:YbhB/YbcL family Raf kinase inhibitor-like protein n=1 Tax=Streptomyces bungoensis TaxID=285568 RepID=UPI00367FD4CA
MRKGWVLTVAAMAVTAGCGGGGGPSSSPSAAATTHLTVSSPAYPQGGTIPRRYTCDGEDVSPPLAIAGVPAHTAGLALTLRDPDAPHGTFTHWLVWNMGPGTTGLTAGAHPQGATEGRNGFRKTGYGGPCPPHGDEPHHYVLTVYATDRPLHLAPDATEQDLLHALAGHTLATGSLTGRYGR